MTGNRRTTRRLRQILCAGLTLPAALTVFAALAWACNPQAHISVGQAGDVVNVYGSYFPGSAEIAVSGSWGASTTVVSSPMGGFITQLPRPATPGNYSVSASRPTGGFAPASFTVLPALPAPPPPPPPVPPAPPAPQPPPAPISAIERLAPAILRTTSSDEKVRVSRTGRFELYCGQFTTSGVRGTCGATSRRVTSNGRAYLKLTPGTFVAEANRRVRMRFKLTAYALGRLKAARKLRMTGRIVATAPLGGRTSRATFRFTLQAPKPA